MSDAKVFEPVDLALQSGRTIPGARFEVIDFEHGHRAGNPTHCPRDESVLRAAVRALLED